MFLYITERPEVTMEKDKTNRLIYKEVTDIDTVNLMVRNGWKLHSVSKIFGKYIFMMVKD